MKLPDARLPDFGFPDGRLPAFGLPSQRLPTAALPSAALPDFRLPDASLPAGPLLTGLGLDGPQRRHAPAGGASPLSLRLMELRGLT